MLNGLVFDSESLNRILEGGRSADDCIGAYNDALADPSEMLAAAASLRDRHKGRLITFSKKAFLNVVNLCRDTCSYCTYKAQPLQSKISMMDSSSVRHMVRLAKEHRCVEALLVTGERPEEAYPEARRWLKSEGYSSTPEYLAHVSEMCLEGGLFPHTNAGNLERDEIRALQKTNVSIGLMLESSSDRLAEKGMPHHLAPSKMPKNRIRALEDAGREKIPTTTGILIGIGESAAEAIDSIDTIRRIHGRYGHIQEIILQNFHPKGDTAMRSHPAADAAGFMALVALARIMMPDMNIQIPPNLSPETYPSFVRSGINDWGGISPLTPDFVNPEFSWPRIDEVMRGCSALGYSLKCRFPVYPEFARMVPPALYDKMCAASDSDMLVEESRWR